MVQAFLWRERRVLYRRAGALSPGLRCAPSVVSALVVSSIVFVVFMALAPGNDAERSLQTSSLALIDNLMQTRWLLIEQSTAAVSTPLLIATVVWLATIAGCLYAPRNGTVPAVSILCSLSVAGAIFLILEMYDPFRGLMKISDAPI